MEEEIKITLKKILGDDAFNNGKMQVSHNVSVLIKSVDYLTEQLFLLGRFVNEDDKELYNDNVEKILKMTNNILK